MVYYVIKRNYRYIYTLCWVICTLDEELLTNLCIFTFLCDFRLLNLVAIVQGCIALMIHTGETKLWYPNPKY